MKTITNVKLFIFTVITLTKNDRRRQYCLLTNVNRYILNVKRSPLVVICHVKPESILWAQLEWNRLITVFYVQNPMDAGAHIWALLTNVKQKTFTVIKNCGVEILTLIGRKPRQNIHEAQKIDAHSGSVITNVNFLYSQ